MIRDHVTFRAGGRAAGGGRASMWHFLFFRGADCACTQLRTRANSTLPRSGRYRLREVLSSQACNIKRTPGTDRDLLIRTRMWANRARETRKFGLQVHCIWVAVSGLGFSAIFNDERKGSRTKKLSDWG
jgi:hypothetical protein